MAAEDENPRARAADRDHPSRRKKTFGEIIRERALYAAPTIIIVYPIVGYLIGYLTVRYLHWPFWVPIVTMVAGLIQAIRELHALSRKIYGNEGGKHE